MTLGEKIRYLRRSKDWTRQQLGEHSNVPQDRIAHLEDGGKDRPQAAHIEAIANALDLSLADLLTDLVDLPSFTPEDLALDVEPLRITVESGERETSIIHSASAVGERDENVAVVDRQVTTHVFAVPPARVGAQFQVSVQISSDQWMGVRVWTERPCAPEDVETTREAVITETREVLDRQYRRLLHEAAAAYRLDQPGLNIS